MKTSNFSHIVFTRFNISLHDGQSKKYWCPDNGYGRSKIKDKHQWEQYRLDLMLKYCYPAILNQTNKNFIWSLLLHPDTDKDVVDKISSLNLNNQHKPQVVFVGQSVGASHEDTADYITRTIFHNCPNSKKEYLITTIVDSDDIICDNYVDIIQQNIFNTNLDSYEFLNIPIGVQYSIRRGRYIWIYHPKNMLISRLEQSDKATTMLSLNHFYINESKIQQVYTNQTNYIITTHQANGDTRDLKPNSRFGRGIVHNAKINIKPFFSGAIPQCN